MKTRWSRGLFLVSCLWVLAAPARGQEIMPIEKALTAGNPLIDRLSFAKLEPCRIIDTRVAGGSLAPGAPRAFRIWGTDLSTQGGSAAGCGLRFGSAGAALINLVAVNPVGPGNLRAWSYEQAIPTASMLNYASVPGLNIANMVIVPICSGTLAICPNDFRVQADVNGTHLVADILGYFDKGVPMMFDAPVGADNSTALGTSCTHAPGAEITVTVPSEGRLLVQAQAKMFINHTGGTLDSISTFIGAGPTDCSHQEGSYYLEIPTGLGNSNYALFAPTWAVFNLGQAGTYTLYLNGIKGGGNTQILGSQARMTAVFTPGSRVAPAVPIPLRVME